MDFSCASVKLPNSLPSGFVRSKASRQIIRRKPIIQARRQSIDICSSLALTENMAKTGLDDRFCL